MVQKCDTSPVMLRRKQVEVKAGLSCSTIYAKMRFTPSRPKEFDPTFPKPVKLGLKAVGWVESEIDAWLVAQIQKRQVAV